MPLSDSRGIGARLSPLPRPVLAVIGVEFAIYLVCAAAFGTWHDEEYTLATTARGPIYAFHRAIDFELQAPLYFVVLALLRTISHGVVYARAFSVICAVAATYAMAEVARRVAPTKPAWPLVLLVALNPFTAFVALEIRLYAFAMLLSVLAWLAFDDGFFAGDDPGARRWFVAIALASLYTQYFLAFEFVGFAVALAVARRFRALRAFALAGAVVALGFMPMLVVLHAQVGCAFGVPDASLPPLSAVFLHPAIDFVLPLGLERFGGRAGYVAVLLSAFALIAATFVGRPRIDARAAALFAIAFVVEAIYVVLADVLRYELVVPRHFIALFVPEIVAAYALASSFASPHARAAAVAIAVVCGVGAIATVGWNFRTFAKQGDWPRVGALLSRESRPGDVIAVTEADALPAFERYYRGPARVVPFPRPLPPDRYDVRAMMVRSVSDAEAALARLPQNGRAWLVIYGKCDDADQLGCEELGDALVAKERVLEKHAFYLNTVLRLAPR